MKTCDKCGMCKKESFQKTSLFIGLSLGAIIGVLLGSFAMILKAVA